MKKTAKTLFRNTNYSNYSSQYVSKAGFSVFSPEADILTVLKKRLYCWMNWKRTVWIKSQKADSLWRSSSTSLHPFCLLLPWKYPLPYLDESSIAAGVICGACACVYVNGYVHAWVHLYMCVIVRECVLYAKFFCHIQSAISYILHCSKKGLLIMLMTISIKCRSEPEQLILYNPTALSCPTTLLFCHISHLCQTPSFLTLFFLPYQSVLLLSPPPSHLWLYLIVSRSLSMCPSLNPAACVLLECRSVMYENRDPELIV